MTIQQAIGKAIKGGWKPDKWDYTKEFPYGFEQKVQLDYPSILIDPSFWKCLGKEIGWEDCKPMKGRSSHLLVCDKWHIISCWRIYWHLLINHLAAGKSIEEYFESL